MNNKLRWFLIVTILTSFLIQNPKPVYARAVPRQQEENLPYVPGQIIVVWGNKRSLRDYQSLSRALAARVDAKVLQVRGNSALLSFDESMDISTIVENVQSERSILDTRTNTHGNIQYAEPNYIFGPIDPTPGNDDEDTPSVPLPNGERKKLKKDEAKNLTTTSVLPTYPADPLLFNTWGWWQSYSDVVWQDKSVSPMVCVLDTGVDANHPDLLGMVVNGLDVINNDLISDDDNGHGTHVAGIIAAKANNKLGIAGVSNSKILAVKVLSSQGWGTSWDIAYGIRYCANNTAVKVINMSLGGTSTLFQYDALQYAIAQKGKLVVAAAGNGGTSDLNFPAAWAANFVCQDGTSTFPSPCYSNTISYGLISVGASRSSWSSAADANQDYYLWVDTDGDGNETAEEQIYVSECATDFSNFGAWVNIVAPGEDITSTVPVSYPYYDQVFFSADADGDGYDTWSGTSMATPFVSGAAARIWSVGTTLFGTSTFNNAMVKNRLVTMGPPINTATDSNVAPINSGYDATYSGEAPFCWPNADKGAFFDMSNARMLNIADAMNRTSIFVYLSNATTGLPLTGATIGAYQGTAVKSMALLSSKTSIVVVLPNVPRGTVYDIKINKSGFTSGLIPVTQYYVDPNGGALVSAPRLSISVPPTGKIHAVLDWVIPPFATSTDIDLYSWLPTYSNFGGTVIGCCNIHPAFFDEGSLIAWPYARWNRDGGLFDWANMESITIMPKAGSLTTPYYNLTIYDYYDFLVTDYGSGALNESEVIFRMWAGGKIIATVEKDYQCDMDGDNDILGDPDDEIWWEPGYMARDQFIPWPFEECGMADTYSNGGIWPYFKILDIEKSAMPLAKPIQATP